MHVWARMGLAALAGGLAVLGMAPFNFWPAVIVALAMLFVALEFRQARRRIGPAAAIGWAFGLTYFGGGLYWIGEAFYVDPATVWMMPFAVTLLPAALAIFYAVATGLAAAVPRRGAGAAFILTASFCAVEYLRSFIFTGFPWNLFGSAFIDSALAQGAAVIGVYGLTFIIALAGFALAVAILGYTRLRFVPLAVATVLMAACFGYGLLRPPPSSSDAISTRVRIVQPDNPQTEKGERDYALRLWRRLLSLTQAPGSDKINVFVWPEGVTPFLLDETPEALGVLGDILQPGQFLIAGSARRTQSQDRMRFYNSLFLVDADGVVLDTYDKAHLVPFGEYLPFPGFFRMLDIASLTARIGGSFSAGPGLRTLSAPGLPGFAPLVCYEALFPAEVIGPGPRPRWMVNVTDDSWFGTQTGPHQHLTSARFRAIEEGLPLVRAATTGISAVIDARGEVVASAPLQTAQFVDADLPPAYAFTVFSLCGHLLFGLLVLGALLGGALARGPNFSD